MRADQLITEMIPPLKFTETGDRALAWMNEFRVSHLPVVDKNDYIGLISEDEIYDMPDPSQPLASHFKNLPKPFVYSNRHVYDIMKVISDHKITVVPILDENNEYIGCTDLLHLMTRITAINSVTEAGGILVLEMNEHDYSLTQIARIVEENNAKVLSSYITSIPESTQIQVTLKINTDDLERIIRTFMRYDYTIAATFDRGEFQENLKQRYDELMKYINL